MLFSMFSQALAGDFQGRIERVLAGLDLVGRRTGHTMGRISQRHEIHEMSQKREFQLHIPRNSEQHHEPDQNYRFSTGHSCYRGKATVRRARSMARSQLPFRILKFLTVYPRTSWEKG